MKKLIILSIVLGVLFFGCKGVENPHEADTNPVVDPVPVALSIELTAEPSEGEVYLGL